MSIIIILYRVYSSRDAKFLLVKKFLRYNFYWSMYKIYILSDIFIEHMEQRNERLQYCLKDPKETSELKNFHCILELMIGCINMYHLV